MKFRATIDFDITDECMKEVYKNSEHLLMEEIDNYFKHKMVTDFDERSGMTGYYRGTEVREV